MSFVLTQTGQSDDGYDLIQELMRAPLSFKTREQWWDPDRTWGDFSLPRTLVGKLNKLSPASRWFAIAALTKATTRQTWMPADGLPWFRSKLVQAIGAGTLINGIRGFRELIRCSQATLYRCFKELQAIGFMRVTTSKLGTIIQILNFGRFDKKARVGVSEAPFLTPSGNTRVADKGMYIESEISLNPRSLTRSPNVETGDRKVTQPSRNYRYVDEPDGRRRIFID